MPHNHTSNPQAAVARAENTDLRTRLHALADEVAADGDLYVVEVQVRGQKGSRIIEVFVDADEGAGVDDMARLSRDLEFLLDTEDVVKGRYTLNVSSPGADRPLRLPRQYPQHIGRTLRVQYNENGEAAEAVGTLASVGDDSFTIEKDDGSDLDISFPDVTEARIQLPW